MNPAREPDVARVFVEGARTVPGAYRLEEMREVAAKVQEWKEKLADSHGRYVGEEISVYAASIHSDDLRKKLLQLGKHGARAFVSGVLHFRLDDGTLLRDHLSNLEERAATRNAVKCFLHHHEILRPPSVDNPLAEFNHACNATVLALWRQHEATFWQAEDVDLARLFVLNATLNSIDFEGVRVGRPALMSIAAENLIRRLFAAAGNAVFCSALGGETFLREFLERWVAGRKLKPTRLVYFAHKNGQLVVSLKCVEALLQRSPGLVTVLVPKGASYGTEATHHDLKCLLDEDEKSATPVFSRLSERLKRKRLLICEEGPRMEGLHPGCLSHELCYHLQRADVIFAEGQAYAEIRGWLKPTYVLFQVKGRVAEAIHGVSRAEGALACIRLGHGAIHFSHLERLHHRVVPGPARTAPGFHVFGQTTRDYVQAIRSDNYRQLLDRFFHQDEAALLRRLSEESTVTGRTMAEIVMGAEPLPPKDVVGFRQDPKNVPEVFAFGGGGGFAQVTLKALRRLGLSVAAGVPSTDDGGSTGRLQKLLDRKYGYVFGMGDAAAILEQQLSAVAKRMVLSYRIPEQTSQLVGTMVKLLLNESVRPATGSASLKNCPDFLSFVCEQLNFARTLEDHFLGPKGIPDFTVEGASVRNLAVLAALQRCGALKPASHGGGMNAQRAESAWFLLEEALGLRPRQGHSIQAIPVSYDRAMLWATYAKPVPSGEIKRLRIPPSALSKDLTTVWGQHYIDEILPTGPIVDFGVSRRTQARDMAGIHANGCYLQAMRAARLVIMGAGSLFGSQLSQLAMPGVLDVLLEDKARRRVLVVNHVCMNETLFYSLTDHIRAIERLAARILRRPIQIGDLFTDVIVPRTVAREIDVAMRTELTTHMGCCLPSGKAGFKRLTGSVFVDLKGRRVGRTSGLFKNRYLGYVLEHKEFAKQQRITDWELRVLSYLEQPPSLFNDRSESGRYRGPVYAVQSDFDYLLTHGIPARNIYEAESIGMIQKTLKAEGKPQVEEFPGLLPESLMGIFKILLQKATVPRNRPSLGQGATGD
jgi:hypothetical protein